MTIEEASERLGKTPQSIRLWLRSGHCPFGDAWKGSGKGYDYYISEERLNAWLYAYDIKKSTDPPATESVQK